jgi:tetratricopeptide (TPR) repeat protein
LIEARAWAGDRAAALLAYSDFKTRLAAALGVNPSAGLARIANLLHEGRGATPRLSKAGRVSERRERPFKSETLIGREVEFACLYDAWLDVRRGEPRIMVVLGDPGVGKTTLTNAFVSTCQMDGAAIARAQAYDAERELPFAVLAELVRQLTLQRALGGTAPEALSELTRVTPDVAAAFPGAPKPPEWSAEVIPLRLADAFLKAVEATTEETPLVLVVDDIHAADNASVAILHVIARKLPQTRLLVILTARSNELRMTAARAALVADTSIPVLQTLELDPLAPPAAERLVAALVAKADRRLADVPVPRILQAARGNPLAVELLTKEWLEQGSSSLLSDLEALNTQPVANLGIPRAIATVFERQLRRLDARTRAALDLAAVLGRRLADLRLYAVVELSPTAAGEALAQLTEEGMLREVQGGLEFRNELIRAQAYYAVAGPERRHLHRRVGETLEGLMSPNRQSLALEVAWHFLRAADPARALPLAVAGAKAALRVGAPLEAEQILTVLLPTLSRDTTAQACKLLLARALVDQSKADRALPLLAELCSDEHLATRDFAEATRLRAAALYLLSREAGIEHSRAAGIALEAARRTDDPELVTGALFEYARSGLEAGDDRRLGKARQELIFLAGHPKYRHVANAWYALGFCHYSAYDLKAACTCVQRAIDLLEDSRNVVALSLAHNALGVCKYSLCEFAPAIESLMTALELARRMGDDVRVSITAANLTTLHNLAGNFAEAVRFGCISVEVGAALPSHPRLTSSYTNLAEAYVLSGQTENALECLERAARWVKTQRSWRAHIDFLTESANMALVMRNVALALELIQSLEMTALGRERAVPEAGMFEKLRLWRLAHTADIDVALKEAVTSRSNFRDRHPLYFLEVLAVEAWLQRRQHGSVEAVTRSELQRFVDWGATGLRTALTAQGFLD